MVRISGPQALSVVHKLFRPLSGGECPFEPRRLYLGDILSGKGGEVLDRVMAVYMPAPASYTREDVVEISCHGGGAVANLIVERIMELGVRHAEAGEFTRRAFLNGAMDITMAEAVAELSKVGSPLGASIAAANLKGELSGKLRELKDSAVILRAEVEARIEFEENVGKLDREGTYGKLDELASEIEELLGSYRTYRLLRRGVEVIICGRVNVGKTTLFNRLLGSERGLVDRTAGTTRDWIAEEIEIGGVRVRLVDTAGFGLALRGLDGRAVARSEELLGEAERIVYMLDATGGVCKEDVVRIEENINRGVEQIVVLNKVDIAKDYQKVLAEYSNNIKDGVKIIPISAKSGQGMEEFNSALADMVGISTKEGADRIFVNTRRQYRLLRQIAEDVTSAKGEIKPVERIEVLAYLLTNIQEGFEQLLGERYDEDMLEEIFTNFCIGK